VAVEVLSLAEDPDVALPSLARVVSRDPALVAKILRTVNSSVYNLSHTIGSVDRALIVLGLEGVKTLVLGFSLVGDLRRVKSRGGFDHLAYWRRSLYAGTAAKILAEEFRVPLVEEAFLAALLMDIGMLSLDRTLGREYGAIASRAKSHDALAKLEQEALGMTHADVAGLLAERWKLPPVLAIPLAFHHRPDALEDSAIKEIAKVVWLAGRCADVFTDAEPEWSLSEVRRTCIERYDLSEIACGALLARIGMRTRELAPMFEIALDEERDYESILKRASEGLAKLMKGMVPEVGSPQDKRRAPRFARDGFIMVFPMRPGAAAQGMRAQFRDASAQGIGLSLQVGLQPGDQFVIRLQRKNAEPAQILYTVVRCDKKGENDFRIGAELTCVMRKPTDIPPTATAATPATADDGRNVDRLRSTILAGQ
jgi:HD-like signal output (HDOD) protein